MSEAPLQVVLSRSRFVVVGEGVRVDTRTGGSAEGRRGEKGGGSGKAGGGGEQGWRALLAVACEVYNGTQVRPHRWWF